MTQALEIWTHILIHPGEATFKSKIEKPQATGRTALAWLTAAVLMLALPNAASTFFTETFFPDTWDLERS